VPKGFLSHSRQDAAFVSQLEAHLLAAAQFDTWRDVHSLRAGDRWPRKLGDAIAASPIFILIWSTHARASDFVELEWTIVIALKRTICIITLDACAEPPTLSPYQTKRTTDPHEAVAWLLNQEAPAAAVPTPVLQKLSETSDATTPNEIAAGITLAFLAQSASNVQGSVFQSAGPMIINHYGEPKKPSPKIKSLAAVALIALAVIGVGVVLPRLRNTTAAQPSTPQPFRGFVQDDQGDPLPGVTITAPTLHVPSQTTDSNGRFSFQIDLPVGTNFRLIAQKPGFETYTADPPSGDTTFNISLHRVSQKRNP